MQKEIGWLLKEKYNNKPCVKFFKDIERLKAGEPVDYVIGFTEFLGCKIDLSKSPLIPRPETEYWVNETLKIMNHNCDGRRNCDVKVLDMFAGSGCIGIAVLKNIKNVKVDFADKEENCIKQIKINLKLNPSSHKALARQSKVIKSDVFSNIKGKYDYIFANPPYIPKTKINKIQKSVLKFEPKTALFGGIDGLFFIKKLLYDAKQYLNENGKIFIEFDFPQKKEIEKLIKEYKYSHYEFHKDQYNRWRWVSVTN